MNLLLIDDDEDDVSIFTDALREISPTAILQRFASAEAALREMVQETIAKPDLLLIDVNMPVINGWQCLREIKKLAGWQGIPLIMYSSADLEATGVKPVDVGAVAFYQKSDSFDSLKARLRQIIASTLPSRI
jgi:DNA-binding response OmpR family regulator